MKIWRRALTTERAQTELAQSMETNIEVAPVFSCDPSKQQGCFRLKHGKWAGMTAEVSLKCCENPLCECANVDFFCAIDDGSAHPAVLQFALDPLKRSVALNDDKNRHDYSAELAEAVAAEFGKDDWQRLYVYLLLRKRKAIRDMDVTKLPVLSSQDIITDDGSMVEFGAIFPFAIGFEFDLDGEYWVADDQYCVMPDCKCREVALSFLHLAQSQGDSRKIAEDQIPIARYDYKTGTITPIHNPAAGQPSLNVLVNAARKAHPSLAKDAKHRHGQLKTLYARALLNANSKNISIEKPFLPTKPTAGRNDPCPCGSGKKFKKCCGM